MASYDRMTKVVVKPDSCGLGWYVYADGVLIAARETRRGATRLARRLVKRESFEVTG